MILAAPAAARAEAVADFGPAAATRDMPQTHRCPYS
jgi:hypothetical protein